MKPNHQKQSSRTPGDQFFDQWLADKVPKRSADPPVYGVYSLYESDASGNYSVPAGVLRDVQSFLNNHDMPIKRFLDYLRSSGHEERYMCKLVEAFNPNAVEGFMCRTRVSVDWTVRPTTATSIKCSNSALRPSCRKQ